MRYAIRCEEKGCGYRWQVSDGRGAVLAVQDHRRGYPKHDVVVVRLKERADD